MLRRTKTGSQYMSHLVILRRSKRFKGIHGIRFVKYVPMPVKKRDEGGDQRVRN